MHEAYLGTGLANAAAHAQEEMGELNAALGKAGRFGWNSGHPDLNPADRETNAQWALREAVDAYRAIAVLIGELREYDRLYEGKNGGQNENRA